MSDLFGGPKPADVSRERKIEALERELNMRRRVYPRWVGGGKMTQEKADEEMLVFEAILADYKETR